MKIKILRPAALIIVLFALLAASAAASSDFVALPRSVTVVSQQTFQGSENLTEVVLHDGVQRIESCAFAGSGLKYINLPDSIRYIAPDAFDGCENLQAVCAEGSYAYDYCANAGIRFGEKPLVIFVLQSEKEITCADGETAMESCLSEAAEGLDQRLQTHFHTSADGDTQAQYIREAVERNADMVLLNLADAGRAEEFAQILAGEEIPFLCFNAEPAAAAVKNRDTVFVGSKNGSRPGAGELAKACVKIAFNRLASGEWLQGSGYTSKNGWSVLLEPAYRLTGLKIGIDPGHQRKANSGKEPVAPGSSKKKAKVSSGTYGVVTKTAEYVRVLEISKKLKKTLEAQGAEVYMTRETHDVNISNVERAKMMNELNVDLVLRIHCDGFSSQSVNGITLFVRKSGAKAEASYNAAKAILPAMIKATGANDRGVKKSNDYSGLNWSTVPCILVECGFMTNKEEDKRLADPKYQQKLANGMTNGICSYFKR